MIKARAGDLLLFGLSERNLQLLREGRPIAIDLAELGVAGRRVVIFHGATEEIMEHKLKTEGLITDATKILGDPIPEAGGLTVDEHPDTARLNFLDGLVQQSVVSLVTSAFELDGGIHLTIERPSHEPEAYRYQPDLRTALDLARKKAAAG